ncbi:MAG TPA: TRAP transporter substrate-binding protein [Burkholderiales bacterium]|nr:TRAP transporter substrate-binding protein [Burkholderiales bacterium]
MKRIAGWLGLIALGFSAPGAAQVTLIASSPVPPSHILTAAMLVPMCQDFEKVTSGRVRCNVLPKAPVAAPQTFDAVRDGLTDLSFTVHGYTPGRFTLTEAVEFPFMADRAEALSVAYQRVHERMLAKADEHRGVVALALFTHGPGQIHHTSKPVSSLADLKGQKIRVGGGMSNDIATALGAVPLLRPAPEVFEILKTGVADGLFFPKESVMSFKLTPVLRHATLVPGGLYNVSFVWMANPDKWKTIPAADRKLIEPLLGEALATRSGRAWDASDERGEQVMREGKIQIQTASPAFMEEIRTATAQLEDGWVKRAKGKGIDGRAVIAALRAEIKSFRAK